MAELNETVTELNNTQNGTAKIPATPEGMAIAYGSLLVMAVMPIILGSFRSVKFHNEQKKSGEAQETMSNRDAAMFPIIASVTLFGIYIFFQMFSKDYINMLLTVYFFVLGVLALSHVISPLVNKLMPESFPNMPYHLKLTQGADDKTEVIMEYKFDRKDIVCLGLCSILGVWYLLKKHWIANNLFGLAFAINGIELLQLNRVSTGCILLGGLFFYDIFWVFGTNVMVTVAKSFEAPIKLVFPQDLITKGLMANNFAMLGLGDIVIPGIFIALLLRLDISINKDKRTYFYSGMVAYFLGLAFTIFVMHVFKHAQPALLYLVPTCLGIPLAIATLKGELKVMFDYADNPETKEAEKDAEKKTD